jgi:hypothetical protein
MKKEIKETMINDIVEENISNFIQDIENSRDKIETMLDRGEILAKRAIKQLEKNKEFKIEDEYDFKMLKMYVRQGLKLEELI